MQSTAAFKSIQLMWVIMPIKLTLERYYVASYQKGCNSYYDWRFRQEPYTRESWETFELPAVCGVAGVYTAYLEDEQDIESWKDKLKGKAMQELQEAKLNIQQQIDSLGNIN